MGLFHLLGSQDWDRARAAGIYRPASLESEGFIHFSSDRQLLPSAERFFAGRDDVVVLAVDHRRLGAELKLEPADGQLFPHLYGPLELDAVLEALPLPRGPDGHFDVPAEWAPRRAFFR